MSFDRNTNNVFQSRVPSLSFGDSALPIIQEILSLTGDLPKLQIDPAWRITRLPRHRMQNPAS
jgi:hypothetical protein